jgi:hypothetical protein
MIFPNAPIQDPITSGNERQVNASTWVIWLKKLADFIVKPTFNYFQFDKNYTGIVPTTDGTISWNAEHHTINIQANYPDSSLQVGQEEWVHVMNMTGVTIPTNSVVYINGSSGDHPTIALASASTTGNTSYIVGMTTNTILDGTKGFVTVRGMIHGFDTSSYSTSQGLYVSDSVLGGLTSVQPTPPNYTHLIAITLDSKVDGIIYVRFGSPDASINATLAAVAAKDPTGFNFNDQIVETYDSSARTITLTGNLTYTWRGKVSSLVSPWTSTAHSSTLDLTYFLYSTDGITFTWSTSVWAFSDIMVAFVKYGTADKLALREVHGLMPWQSHEEFHTQIGTYRKSGGGLAGYVIGSSTPANRRPTVAATLTKDEDVETTNPALTSSLYTKLYLTSTGTSTFTVETADIVPLSGANPYYNQFSTPNWVQTLMSNNSYMSVWLVSVPVTADTGSQKYRYLWLQGQNNGSLVDQQALFPASLNLGQLTSTFTEFVFIAKVIIRYQGGDWDITEVTVLTGNRTTTVGSPSGAYLTAVAHDTTLTGLGTIASPLSINTVTETIATAAGSTGTAALPATPAGFITRTFNNVAYKIPVYPV